MLSNQTMKELNQIKKSLLNMEVEPDKLLQTEKHIKYLHFVLHNMKESVINFEVAQPWVYYYLLHSIHILQGSVSQDDEKNIIKALSYCFNQGFAGGYLQLPHLAPTYAAFLTLLEIGPSAIQQIDRQSLRLFFQKCKKGGIFIMHELGESDMRGSYIVIIITKLLKLGENLLEGVAENILNSQTYQGGIANVIGGEAHGGYTFCAVASLALMNKLHLLDVSRLLLWLSRRQVQFGGFNGRTNKLIDSCYSFWIGSCFMIINQYFQGKVSLNQHLLYCQQDLQRYLLLYCQDKNGGFVDKPGKPKDVYHTCYALSGLSLSHYGSIIMNNSQVQEVDPIYNILKKKLMAVKQSIQHK